MATSSTTRRPVASPLPCLFLDYGDRQPGTLYSVSDGARHPCDVDELRCNKRSWVTSHGWVLVWDPATLATFLWDPHAAPNDNNKITLPSLTHPPMRAGCTLSANPTDPNGYTVLLVDKSASLIYYCHVGHLASGSGWVRHEYDVGSIPLPSNDGSMKRIIYRAASCHGRFYYLRKHGEIGIIEFSPAGAPVFSTTPMRGVQLTPVGDYMAAASAYLIDLDGELYVAYIFFHNTDFRTVTDVGVYHLDFDMKEPVRVDGIGDRAILLGSSCSLGEWCPATTLGLLPNSVYWMSLHDGRLHVYDLKQKTEEVREPCSGVVEPSRKPFWLLPKHP